jgi:hypothetical protein
MRARQSSSCHGIARQWNITAGTAGKEARRMSGIIFYTNHVTRTHCALDARGTGSALGDAGVELWAADEIA